MGIKNKRKNGFTLIEAVVVFSLLAIITFGLASFIINALQAWLLISNRDAAVATGRVTMNRLVAELRRIKSPSDILVSASTECKFLDLDANTIDFVQTGTNLYRNGDSLCANLAASGGLLFTYLGSTGEVTAVTANMRAVRVKLSLIAGPQMTTLESSARIRNL